MADGTLKIDMLPAGLKTQEGIDRCTKAGKTLDAAQSAFAHTCNWLMEDIFAFVEERLRTPQEQQQWEELTEEIRNAKARWYQAGNEFCDALAGRPESGVMC
jgi:hypothetical protein